MSNNIQIEEQKAILVKVVSSIMGDGNHSEQELRENVKNFRPAAAPNLSDDEIESVIRQLTQLLLIDVELGTAITSKDFVSWLPNKKSEMTWDRWKAYKQWLLNTGRPPKVVDKLGQLTDEILDLVGDPHQEGNWARRGLVIGDVQSGKTATYLGLLNKAVDAGFRLIIVLAGGTESLRQQTQLRLDESLIGRDSRNSPDSRSFRRAGVKASPTKFIGVGLLNHSLANAVGMTTVMQDFKTASQEATNISVDAKGSAPYIFVVKKNKSVLNALQRWLAGQANAQGKLDLPVLLLDDESDYASVNTREDISPTAINDGIRGILGQFTRSSYLAFTATPFANIFIDHEETDDLFPRDFVYGLEAPSNYAGVKSIFGTTDATITTHTMDISDAGKQFPAKHRANLNVTTLPSSLLMAIRVYFLSCAIRDCRGDNGAKAMLVNVSRFKRVQSQVFELIEDYAVELRNAVDLHSQPFADGVANAAIQSLKDTFVEVFPAEQASWNEILAVIGDSVADIRIELHNSDRDKELSEKELVWDRAPRMIAIGGDVLSRGLTLDGLAVSYFYRRAAAFDTLMQMGRWFGYRDGYGDLCRVWIDEEVASDYRFIDEAVDELRRDLVEMKSQKQTPSDFGLAIKKHPGALLVTARNKMKSAAVQRKSVSLAGRRIESTKLAQNPSVLENNLQAFKSLLDGLAALPVPRRIRSDYNWREGVDKALVAEFLDEFRADQSDPIWLENHLSQFVSRSQSPALQKWDVVVINGDKPNHRLEATNTPKPWTHGLFEIWPPQRSVSVTSTGRALVSGKSSRIAGPGDVAVVLSENERASAIRNYRDNNPSKKGTVPEIAYYSALARPVLFIYPLKAKPEEPTYVELGSEEKVRDLLSALKRAPVIAVKLAIPGNPANVSNQAGDVEYVINTVAQRNWFSELVEDDGDE